MQPKIKIVIIARFAILRPIWSENRLEHRQRRSWPGFVLSNNLGQSQVASSWRSTPSTVPNRVLNAALERGIPTPKRTQLEHRAQPQVHSGMGVSGTTLTSLISSRGVHQQRPQFPSREQIQEREPRDELRDGSSSIEQQNESRLRRPWHQRRNEPKLPRSRHNRRNEPKPASTILLHGRQNEPNAIAALNATGFEEKELRQIFDDHDPRTGRPYWRPAGAIPMLLTELTTPNGPWNLEHWNRSPEGRVETEALVRRNLARRSDRDCRTCRVGRPRTVPVHEGTARGSHNHQTESGHE